MSRRATLVGLELNARSAQAIRDESMDFPEISGVQANGFALPFQDNSFDYAIQSLTLHHFDDKGAVSILREMARVAARGIFVIDLHRNPVAYFFYPTVGRLFLHNSLLREDGGLSILKSFTPPALGEVGRRARVVSSDIE